MHSREKALIEQLSQRLSPIVANSGGLRPDVRRKGRQGRLQVITAEALKIVEKNRSPIGVISLEAVAENCIRRIGAERLEQAVSNIFQIVSRCAAIEVIEHESFRAERRTLHLHARAAGNKEVNRVSAFEIRGKRYGSSFEI